MLIARKDGLGRLMLEGRMHGIRPTGQQKKRWMDEIPRKTGMNAVEATETARDREE